MPTLAIDGRTLHYQDRGAGDTLLLLHGFPMHGESFWPQLDHPPQGARLLVPDHRGFGESSPGIGPLLMDDVARDALALLDALAIDRALVGGVSMGGYATMALLRLAPERVRGLALIGTHARPDDAAGKAKREATARETEEQGIEPLVRSMFPSMLSPGAPEAVRERLSGILLATEPAAAASAARGMALRPDSRATLADYRGPSLVVHGALDAIVPVDRGRELAQLLRQHDGHCEYQELATGHLANLEAPEVCRAAFERLRQHAEAGES